MLYLQKERITFKCERISDKKNIVNEEKDEIPTET